MAIRPQDTVVAYRCPACGKSVISVTGVFALTGDMIKLKCGCGESELLMKNEAFDKVRLTLPCLFCAHPHQVVISKEVLVNNEIFSYACSNSGAEIFFSGTKGEVLKAIEEADRDLAELIDDTELAQIYEQNRGEEDEMLYNDEHVRDMILFVLGDLCEEGKIECDCKDGGDFLVDNEIGKVRIMCKKCGKRREYFCTENMETRDLFDAVKIKLV
jgi:transcription elongation factor Elf1